MLRRRKSLLFVVAGLAALFASATATGAGRPAGTVQVAAPSGAEEVVAYGRSQLLLIESVFSNDPGITRINLNGSVDRSFGDKGTVEIAGEGATVTPDGKILVSGSSRPKGRSGSSDARVTRLLPDGRPDPSFGAGGRVDVDFGGRHDTGQAAAPAANGGILLAGYREDSAVGRGESNAFPAVARLRPDGSIDRSFGRKGVRALAGGGGEIEVFEIARTRGGGIVVYGGNEIEAILWKLTRDGAVDRRFGRGGRLDVPDRRVDDGYPEELFMAPQLGMLPGGKLLLAATGFPSRGPDDRFRAAAVRLRPDGRVDRSYGDDGWATMSSRRSSISVEGLALLPGGVLTIAVTLTSGQSERRDFGAIAFGPGGRLDRRFGNRGRCRAGLAGDHGALGVAALGRRAAVVGYGEGGQWLLECPPLRGR